MISDDRMLNPLFDPQEIDPENESIQGLVNLFDSEQYRVGQVCDAYEMCSHLLCETSYELWCALQVTKQALAGKEIKL